ncbi:hypothetical protein R3X27_04030 [Tropicimonas sp. TH_r6]|uniref:hypothetical protein n=1 Tax=Tropicimonas sp. TH_r6 TaxID=3082085 RepID=UPI00295313AD|nr:hypothetical protein [Tropicimonas sp. TH_r6]MDV7141845.1 hypothetical protein [Tropicimonas sp. TH_r6]
MVRLAGWLETAEPGFDGGGLVEQAVARFPELELKQRIDWIADCLMARLPAEFPAAAAVIARALPPPLDPERSDDDFGDFIIAPFGVVVERLGLEQPEPALDLLEALTQRFSMEMSIRAFLDRWPEEVLARMALWVEHPNYHVRRLVSEGTRPKLPWARAIALPPEWALPLLDRLHSDPTRYVTRSVSNHLNDIAKRDPETVLARLEAWRSEGRQDRAELTWMARHSLRTLLKAGDARALAHLGYRTEAPVALEGLELGSQRVEIGAVLEFTVTLRADASVPALVDYVVEFEKAGGRRGEKVFRLKDTVLLAGKPVALRKKHRFKGDATTFTLYPGRHALRVQVNGRCLGEAGFDLVAPGAGA